MSLWELTIPGGNEISQWLFAVQVVQGNCTRELQRVGKTVLCSTQKTAFSETGRAQFRGWILPCRLGFTWGPNGEVLREVFCMVRMQIRYPHGIDLIVPSFEH